MTDTRAQTKAGYILLALFFASVLAFLDRSLLNILIRPIRGDIGIDDIQFSLLQGASFSLVYAAFTFPLAWLSDQFSRKAIILISIVVWSAMAVLFGLANSFTWLLFARMGLAIGEASLSPASIAILRQIFPPERQAFAVALLTISLYVGGGLSMAIGGPVLTFLEQPAQADGLPFGLAPWRLLFIGCGALGALGFVLLLAMPDVKREPRPRSETSVREFLRLVGRDWAAVTAFLLAFCGVVSLVVVAAAWTPAIFLRAHGWSEQQTGLGYGLVYIVGGIIGALFSGRLVGLLVARGARDAVNSVLLVAALVAGVATALLGLASSGTVALGLAFVAMLAIGPLVALGSFAFQGMFPGAFSARAVALYFLTAGTVGTSVGPTAVPLLQKALGEGATLSQAYAIFSALAAIWAVAWLSIFMRVRRPQPAVLSAVAAEGSTGG